MFEPRTKSAATAVAEPPVERSRDVRNSAVQDKVRPVVQADAPNEPAALFARTVSKNEIIYLTSQLAIMVDTGINLATALNGILTQEQNPTLRRVINDLKSGVESGDDFSTALARHPKYFDRTYVAL